MTDRLENCRPVVPVTFLVCWRQEKALDRLSDHLHPVHRALHIFARLGMLDDFKAWYLECRRPMAEMRSMITRYAPKNGQCVFSKTCHWSFSSPSQQVVVSVLPTASMRMGRWMACSW